MKTFRAGTLSVAILGTLVATLFFGCARKNDAISKAEKTDATKPSIAETKAIAEEGFIYGLPIVMNYAVTYEFCVDKDSGQYKAPFNQINNDARVFTYKDTAVVTPNSDTPYSMLCLDLRAEPFVLSVPAVEKDRYYSVQLCDGNTFNYGYIGSRATGNEAGRLPGRRPRLERRDARRHQEDVSVLARSSHWRSTALSSSIRPTCDNVEKVQAGYKVQPLSAYLKQPAPPAAPAIDFPKANNELVKKNFFEYLDFALQFAPPGTGRKGNSREAGPHRHRPRQEIRFQRPLARTQSRSGLGMKEGDEKIEKELAGGNKMINGWHIGSFFGDRAFFNGNWLKRAAAAKARHLRQRRRRGHVSDDQNAWPTASRSTAANTTTPSPLPRTICRR